MVFEYTEEEYGQLQEIDIRYARQLDAVDAELKQHTENEPVYSQLLAQREFLEESRYTEMGDLYDQFEKARFDKLGSDQEVLEDAKKQVDLIIRRRHEYDSKYYGITEQDGSFNKETAMKLLKSELKLYQDKLDGEKGKELRDFMNKYLDDSPFIVHKKRTGQQLPEEITELFNAPYVIALGGELTNIMYDLSIRSFIQESKFSDSGTAEVNGIQVKIEGFNDFKGEIGTSTLKLWDAITAYLALNNPYGIKNGINTHIEIPLKEYAEVRGIAITPKKMNTTTEQKKENERARKRKWKFKDSIDRDLNKLSKFRIHSKRKADHDVGNLVLIYDDYKVNDIIVINMPEDTAIYLLSAYPYYYAPELQSLSDSNPSTYRVGRKMSSYCSIDNNAKKGTNNTLKVKTIASYSPFIPSLEELSSQGQRNWKDKIKDPMETVLNELVESGSLINWKYENPRTKKEVNSDDAGRLTANEYWNLNVVFTPKENKQQMKRIIQKQKEAGEKAQAEKPKTAKSRKKTSTEVGTDGLLR